MAIKPRGLTNRSNYCYVNAVRRVDFPFLPPSSSVRLDSPSSSRLSGLFQRDETYSIERRDGTPHRSVHSSPVS